MVKAAPQSCSPKRFPEAAAQSCTPQHLCKTVASKRLCFKAVPQSGSPKVFSKATPKSCSQSCCRKLLPKAVFLKLVPKAAVRQGCCSQSCRAKLATPQSCSPKPIPKVVIESCWKHLLPKAAKALPKLLSQTTPQSCRKAAKLLPAVVPQSCSPKLLPNTTSQRSSPKQCAQAKKASTVCAVEGGCSKRAVSQRYMIKRAQCRS